MSELQTPLKLGMVGGGRDAFIGRVHRMAARLDNTCELVAGALSSTPEKAQASGRELGLDPSRNYRTWQEMLKRESSRNSDERLDVVSIVTPNATHFEIARAFVHAGFNVIVDKPMVMTPEEADQLIEDVESAGVQLCVTYNYSGYPMVKAARQMVRDGRLGNIRRVVVEYHQGWLSEAIEKTGHKQAGWRTDPEMAGGGAIGDIGSHAHQLMRYVTGLDIAAMCADLGTVVPGRRVDDDVNILLRFNNGARGLFTVSQIATGQRNDLRIRVWGDQAGLEWAQEQPEQLTLYSNDQPQQIFYRGMSGFGTDVTETIRLPVGHPEAFIEAFANIYRAFAAAVRNGSTDNDFPDVHDGAAGVRFIHDAMASSRAGSKWFSAPPDEREGAS